MSLVPLSRTSRRIHRAIASALALWLVVGIVGVAAHQADVGHATLTDGTIVHLDAPTPVDVHAGCQRGHAGDSRTGTVDRHTTPVAPADPCFLGDAAQAGFATRPRLEQLARLLTPPSCVRLSARPSVATAVLLVAPKTSPPV